MWLVVGRNSERGRLAEAAAEPAGSGAPHRRAGWSRHGGPADRASDRHGRRRVWSSATPIRASDRAVPTLFASYLRVYEPLSAFDKQSQAVLAAATCTTGGRSPSPRAQGGSGPRCSRRSARTGAGCRICPNDAYVLQADEHDADLSVEPAGAGGRGGAGGPRRRAAGARRRVRAAGARRRGPHGRLGLELRGAGGARTARPASTSRSRRGACRCAGSCWSATRSGNSCWSPGRRVLRYRTEISKARRRAHRALSVLRRSIGDVPISEAVEESARWLEEFHSALDRGARLRRARRGAARRGADRGRLAESRGGRARRAGQGRRRGGDHGIRAAGGALAGNSALRAL